MAINYNSISSCKKNKTKLLFKSQSLKFYVYRCFVWMYVYLFTIYAWCLQRPEEGAESSGTGITDTCELPYWCWESDLGPLEKQVTALNC